jgi:hypothetical protein
MVATRDIDIRAALRKTELADFYRDGTSRVVEEFGIDNGITRIDIAVVNGVFHGYEIKSDADTLDRLPTQAASYNRVFDFIWIVAGEKHLEAIGKAVPAFWGICLAAKGNELDKVKISRVRIATMNESSDPLFIAKLLWKAEAIDLLSRYEKARGLERKPRAMIYKLIASIVPKSDLSDYVRSTIKMRESWRAD